ncbi:MAG: hypothetical protein HWE12_04925 [Oceanospirillaceae bacterium]|nr:hypothetical protein [Oceanospirillaceae bacterium]
MKVDVSIQSYNKPEFLIHTLFNLHKYSKSHVDTVWINGDRSTSGVVEKYRDLAESDALYPWKIKYRINSRRIGWWPNHVRGVRPRYLSNFRRLVRSVHNVYRGGAFHVLPEDIRYQWAISSTDKKYIFIIHDDMFFHGDVLGLYMRYIQDNSTTSNEFGIVGDLGQCWRCKYKDKCSPQLIMEGHFPSPSWPESDGLVKGHKWSCRINEWCCILNVDAARSVFEQDGIFFGNYDDSGDIGAYWFARAIAAGYRFGDPLPSAHRRAELYSHGFQGKSGHSVWLDQGAGKNVYDPSIFVKMTYQDYGYRIR